MRLSIQRLRWVLITGALLLVGVVAVYIGYGRYRSLKAYVDILKRSGATITHDTNGFTYSQSVQGKTIFTLHAKKATQAGNGKWELHDADMTLYGRIPDRPDHIYSSEIDYDQDAGLARAKGEVHMDLQAPQTLTGAGKAAGPLAAEAKVEPAEVIHVRTSGLVYLRKLGVATTDQQVEFRYGTILCTAQGAEFNTDQSTLHLLADVVMDGVAHGRPVHVTATEANMDRNANVADVTRPVVSSEGRVAKANAAVIELRKDSSVQSVEATGSVSMSSGTQQITGDKLYATLRPQTVLQTAKLSGNVVLVDTSAVRPVQGSANVVDAVFDEKGAPKSAVATGPAKISAVDRKSFAAGLTRSMEGAKITALFVPGGRKSSAQLSEIDASGSAHARGESVDAKASAMAKQPLLKTTQVAADDLRVTFSVSAVGKAQPQKMAGEGHTLLQQDAPRGEQETSSAETLEMTFTPADGKGEETSAISSAMQSGQVVIHDRAASKLGSTEPGAVSTGTAERATYDEATQKVTLSGNAHLNGDNASLSAPTVTLDQRTQDAEASGGVQATLVNAKQGSSATGTRTIRGSFPFASLTGQDGEKQAVAPVTHVLSASARFFHATKLAEFHGTDAAPAKMWQDASQVQAATLLFDGVKRTLSARPVAAGAEVHAVFAGTPSKANGATNIVRVASPKMDYNDLLREATFSSGATIDGMAGEVKGQRAVVFLSAKTPAEKQSADMQPNPFSGSVDRVVVSGDVTMEQPGRSGSGEQLLYMAASNSYVLTGTAERPPHIADAKQGNVTGTTLLFGDAGSTIVVVGEPGGKKRVRTETEVRP